MEYDADQQDHTKREAICAGSFAAVLSGCAFTQEPEHAAIQLTTLLTWYSREKETRRGGRGVCKGPHPVSYRVTRSLITNSRRKFANLRETESPIFDTPNIICTSLLFYSAK